MGQESGCGSAQGLSQAAVKVLDRAVTLSGLDWGGSTSKDPFATVVGGTQFFIECVLKSPFLAGPWLEASLGSLPHGPPHRGAHNDGRLSGK